MNMLRKKTRGLAGYIVALSVVMGLSTSQIGYANDECIEEWMEGVEPEIDSEGVLLHLFTTGESSYDFNDSGSRQDAMREARMRAKAEYSRWQTQLISSEESLDQASRKLSEQSKNSNGEQSKSVSKETTKTTLESIVSHSAIIMQGLQVFGSCHKWEGDSGRVVVRLVWSPKTSAAAQQANETMQENAASTRYDNLPGAGGNTVSGGGSRESKGDF
jgi:hypothetical protein